MVDKSNEYGYIPASPTQSSSSNSGVFGVNDIVGLLTDGKYALQTFPAEVLNIAGAGGGTGAFSGSNSNQGGGRS